MITWKFTIIGKTATIITQDPFFAEKKSRGGYRVFCKRESNIYRYPPNIPNSP